MRHGNRGTDHHRVPEAETYAHLAGASFVLAAVLAIFACSGTLGAEFRWIAPLAAAALNVLLVAVAAQLAAEPQSPPPAAPTGPTDWNLLRASWWRAAPDFARAALRTVRWWPWCVLIGATFSLLLCAATWFVFGQRPLAWSPSAHGAVVLACAAALVLAFVTLVAERLFAARANANHADAVLAGALRVVLVTALVGAACAALYAWASVDARWLAWAAALLPAAIACEYAVRAALTWFTPPSASATPVQVVDSTIAHWLMRPPASPAELGASLRRRYGIDLRQSWVLYSTVRMLPAVCVALVTVAWLLSGVTILQPDQRAVYERFGAPVAVWQPGLHAGLPWPFGHAQVLDNGAVRQIVVSSGADAMDDGGDGSAAAPPIDADARTPEQLDRLWDVVHPWETTQVIAGGNSQQQNFEIVSADVRLDYRVGASDADARASLYRAADVPAVVRAVANREVVRYLASHTLDALIEARQTVIAERIRRAVQQQLDTLGSGIEVVAVVIESVHPPAGVSAAWHDVQAAQIRAAASVAQSRARAAGLMGQAQEQAQTGIAAANATAAEALATARAQQTTFAADIAAGQAGGRAFAFEYYLHNLQKGLQNANLTVIDDRLVTGNRATIDLRSYNAGDAAGAKRLY
ncbi:protease modulator HflK [Paraburkholderia caballeronis]|uniref:protease modulator HflK n=1 Tax=Paraburkholderia caballeronis TaxID=416943 RepID=UPI0010EC290D|nr:protease modulator HflK [Paraburkholderia caballeronis]TDV15695.1 regulator of protease activity HflC (stomatin/prohibitin superfamily) [Paraburkholderia caballeronis]TDV17950.1 regulator of protease activity HflC (stomatin/prohibitin superfamily) [Paraburkholderia caballeronis]TDV26436.1 regulator of protease activity HflC (stomatin/prohibitin superfamily) [Paraburkholderia caballeronis]